MLFRSLVSSAGRASLAVLLAAVLVGCGDSSSNPNPDPNNPDNPNNPNPGSDGGNSGTTRSLNGSASNIVLQSCGVTPATQDLAAGSYTIKLDASSLSKGNVATSPPTPSSDNYVLVYLPLPPGDKDESHRFLMLNGIGSSYAFTLPSSGKVQVMFVDSDQDANTGEASVSIQPGNHQLKVNAVTNVLRWQQGCNSTPATLDLNDGNYQLKLTQSSLSTGNGSHDNYVLVRSPSEDPVDDHRYVILNGLNGTADLNFQSSGTMRVWALGLQNAPGGNATVSVYKQ